MLDLGELCVVFAFVLERARRAVRFPPYTDLLDALGASLIVDVRSGVKGDDFKLIVTVVERVRGDGVRGMRPPAVREEKSPVWDLRGVDTEAVAILSCDDAVTTMLVIQPPR